MHSVSYLKKWFRNRQGQKVGCIVATKDGIGYSLCKKGDKFDPKLAEEICFQRIFTKKVHEFPKSMTNEIDKMCKRAKAYFK